MSFAFGHLFCLLAAILLPSHLLNHFELKNLFDQDEIELKKMVLVQPPFYNFNYFLTNSLQPKINLNLLFLIHS